MAKTIRLAAPLQTDSIVDGPGLRAVIWTQGCSHNCKGCQNPQTHSFNGGELVDVEKICKEISELEYHTGITFSGGDPMFQPEACNEIASVMLISISANSIIFGTIPQVDNVICLCPIFNP